jgi:Zn finger protein HypA/HybF involved in hydrogenase expression
LKDDPFRSDVFCVNAATMFFLVVIGYFGSVLADSFEYEFGQLGRVSSLLSAESEFRRFVRRFACSAVFVIADDLHSVCRSCTSRALTLLGEGIQYATIKLRFEQKF